MMMRIRNIFLLVVLLTIVVQTLSDEISLRKGTSALDRRDRKNNGYSKFYTQDHSDDDYEPPSTYRRNRYSPYGLSSLSNNYPSRSSWPAQYDDSRDTEDWPHHSYGINHLLSKFPSPFSPDAAFHNGPRCHSLIDPQYSLFSDICGAVPQARYSLPNSFGHVEKWQIAQVLSTIIDPITSTPGCTRSLRLLICPLLFPPCSTPYEAPPVLPCQPFCRAIKNQCASPSLDLLPCDLLPPVSDLCPMNPSPYSSLLSSFGQPSPFNGGLPQTPLSSILAQSALSQFDMPSSPFASFLSPMNIPARPMLSAIPSPTASPSNIPGSPFSSMFPSASMPPTNFPASPFSSLFSGAPMSPPLSSPFNSFQNMDPLMESLTPFLVDFPPLRMNHDFRQVPQYFPMTRSATEKV